MKILKQKDKDFIAKYSKEISPLQQWLVKSKMEHSVLTSAEDGHIPVSSIDNFSVTKAAFQQLGVNYSLKSDLMDAVACLFQKRDSRIFESHELVNSNRHGYQRFKQSLYLPTEFWRRLLDGATADELKESFFLGVDWNPEKYLFIYIFATSYDSTSIDPWALFRIDLSTHSINYVDGRIDGRVEVLPPQLVNFLHLVKISMQPLLQYLLPDYIGNWQCNAFRETYFELLNNQYDSGLYTIACTYYLSHGTPLFFKHNSITRLRMTLGYWILVGELPI